jgi:hypothetical protein
MFSIDYELKLSKDGTPFFPDPNIKSIDSDIFMIEAGNGKGKSTLLNLIALGFQINKLDENDKRCYISPILMEELKKFPDRKEITFNMKMVNSFQDGLILQKKNPYAEDVEIYEITDGQQSSLNLHINSFYEKYFFIYDFPQSALKRLDSLVDEVVREQINYRTRLEAFQNYLSPILIDIQNSDNSSRKADIEKMINDLTSKNKQLVDESSSLVAKRNILNKYYHLKAVDYYSYLHDDLVRRIQNLEGEDKKIQKNQKTFSTKHDHSLSALQNTLQDMQQKINELSELLYSLFGKQNSNFIYFKNLDILSVLITLKFDSKFDKVIKNLETELKTYEVDLISKDFKQKAEFYHSLLELFNNPKFSEDILPGTRLKIKEICQPLQNEYNKYSQQLTDLKNSKKSLEILQFLSTKSGEAKNQLDHYIVWVKKKETTSPEITIDRSSELETLRSEFESVDDILTVLLGTAKSGDIFLESILSGDDSEIKEIERQYPEYTEYYILAVQDGKFKDKIDSDLNKISRIDEEITKNIARYDDASAEYAFLLKQKPHEYQQYYEQLKSLENSVKDLLQKFSSYESFLKTIKLGDADKLQKIENLPEFKEYYQSISKFLAMKISSFNFVDDSVTPAEIDLIHRKVLTTTGDEIYFDDISTGQGMSMYLKGLLNRSTEDPRKIIAIFDEVSTLDQNSLGIVIDCLKKLKKEGRLLLSIFVQRGNEKQYNIIKYDGDMNVK